MNWKKTVNYQGMSEYGAEQLFRVIEKAIQLRKQVNIGLATGNTMLKLYPLLADKLNQAKIPLQLLHTYNLDEYIAQNGQSVAPDHSLSYHRYMQENLFRHLSPELGFSEAQRHFPDPVAPAAFDQALADAGGLDLQLLGIGFNGHIAFNEPQSEKQISVSDFAALPTRVIDLKPLTIATNAKLTAGGNDSLVPRQAVSMGMRPILKAKKLLLLACFQEQIAPLKQIRTGKVTPELPASYLLQHPDSEIVYTVDTISLD
ncbi:MAG: 6-phosphogluconolactonase [Lentisphaeria bacterium]